MDYLSLSWIKKGLSNVVDWGRTTAKLKGQLKL
jgi:hypothetical protein